METLTIQRRTISISERIKSLPRKKKKAYKKMLESAKRIQWTREDFDATFTQVWAIK